MAGHRLSGRGVGRATGAALIAVVLVANAAGAAVVFVLLALVVPGVDVDDTATALLANGAAAAAYLLAASVIGLGIGFRRQRPVFQWLREEREPTAEEQRRALGGPLLLFGLHAALWLAASLLFGSLNAFLDAGLGVRVAIAVALGGITTSAVAYLVAERLWRPIAVRALSIGPPPRAQAPGVTVRFVFAWALGTGVPVLGLVLLGIAGLVDSGASAQDLALSMVALGAVALLVGLLAVLVAARAVAGPLRSVRHALAAVERGDLQVGVAVDDASELGRLQAGVNDMVAGLRERERLHDLFGRHVGEDVARAALERGVELGGEVREVAVLFVDVVGSTTLASERPPHEVVELLNRFFAVIVETVSEQGGWVNKFEGDAALAVFGAPAPLEECDARALAAARRIAERLEREVPDLDAGVGVSGGEAVAGNVGSPERFEYTVIGDPVNEAARLTELAKTVPGRVLAAARLLERAPADEAACWREGEAVALRGRGRPTPVATPRGAGRVAL